MVAHCRVGHKSGFPLRGPKVWLGSQGSNRDVVFIPNLMSYDAREPRLAITTTDNAKNRTGHSKKKSTSEHLF